MGLLSAAASGQGEPDATPADNSERIEELEDLVFDLDSRIGSRATWQAYSAESVDLGGALSVVGTRAHGDDSNTTSVNTAFFELYLKAKIDEEFSVFATPGFFWLTAPTFTDGANPMTTPTTNQSGVTFQRAYGEWHPTDAINLKVGRFGTQHGVITSEYFVPSRIITMAPLMARVIGENTLYPQKLDGLQFSGNRASGSNVFEYMAYLGVDTIDSEAFDTGFRAGFVMEELGLSVAVNVGHAKRTGFTALTGAPTSLNLSGFWSPFPIISNSDETYEFYGVDLDYRDGPWVIKSEAYTSDEHGGQPDRGGAYVQPAYYFTPEWSLAARADHFVAGQGLGKASEGVLSLNFNPNANVRYRMDYHLLDLPSAATANEVQMLVFSASFSF
ncbi:MAG: hypothetical protein ACI8QZ_003205 [Chlamydiales bacterium]|jgi:hypothetical protein